MQYTKNILQVYNHANLVKNSQSKFNLPSDTVHKSLQNKYHLQNLVPPPSFLYYYILFTLHTSTALLSFSSPSIVSLHNFRTYLPLSRSLSQSLLYIYIYVYLLLHHYISPLPSFHCSSFNLQRLITLLHFLHPSQPTRYFRARYIGLIPLPSEIYWFMYHGFTTCTNRPETENAQRFPC